MQSGQLRSPNVGRVQRAWSRHLGKMHPQALLLLILLLGTLGRTTSSGGSCSSIAGDVFRYPGGGRAVLDCSPRLANMPAAIFFSLTTDVSDILRCSRIYVEMPGFSRSEGGGDVVLEDTQRMSNKAKWNETTKKLEISVMDEVQNRVRVILGRVKVERLQESCWLKECVVRVGSQ